MSQKSPSDETPTRPSPQQLGSFNINEKEGDSTAHQEHGSPTGHPLPPVASLSNLAGSQRLPPAPYEANAPALSRSIGVHSILNPTGEHQSGGTQRPIQSPNRSISIAYGTQPQSQSPRIRKRVDKSSSGYDPSAGVDTRQNRRILTPKSPAARAASYGQIGSTPGPGGRIYTAEPDSNRGGVIPPLPPLSAAPPNTLPALQQAEAPPGYTRPGPGAPGVQYLPPGAASRGPGSPELSHSVYDRRPESPFRSLPPEGSGSSSSLQSFPPGGGRPPPREYGQKSEYILDLESGRIRLPVDTIQASKLADEKRRRNAGASARFRQRRKEKEQAASQHISDLQRRVREAEEDRDFYVAERNFFRDMAVRSLGPSQIPPRPTSPYLRRATAGPMPIETSPGLEQGQREVSEPAPAQRRRTGDYQPSFTAPSPMGPSPYSSYAPPPPSAGHYSLPPPAGPSGLVDPRTQPQGPPPTTKPQSQDPFRRDFPR